MRDIAEVIGRHLDVPAVSVPAEKAAEHFGPFGMVMTLGLPPVSSAPTRRLLGWEPVHPGLIADLEHGHYFASSSSAAGLGGAGIDDLTRTWQRRRYERFDDRRTD